MQSSHEWQPIVVDLVFNFNLCFPLSLGTPGISLSPGNLIIFSLSPLNTTNVDYFQNHGGGVGDCSDRIGYAITPALNTKEAKQAVRKIVRLYTVV